MWRVRVCIFCVQFNTPIILYLYVLFFRAHASSDQNNNRERQSGGGRKREKKYLRRSGREREKEGCCVVKRHWHNNSTTTTVNSVVRSRCYVEHRWTKVCYLFVHCVYTLIYRYIIRIYVVDLCLLLALIPLSFLSLCVSQSLFFVINAVVKAKEFEKKSDDREQKQFLRIVEL